MYNQIEKESVFMVHNITLCHKLLTCKLVFFTDILNDLLVRLQEDAGFTLRKFSDNNYASAPSHKPRSWFQARYKYSWTIWKNDRRCYGRLNHRYGVSELCVDQIILYHTAQNYTFLNNFYFTLDEQLVDLIFASNG